MDCASSVAIEIQHETIISDCLKSLSICMEMKELTIEIKENKKKWVVFSHFPGVSNYQCSYSFTKTIASLPDHFEDFDSVESLDVSYLGIISLPESLKKMIRLESLNISFNKISISNEEEKLLSLPNLKTLKVYGCDFSEAILNGIRKQRPDLKILYTEDDLLQDMKRRSQATIQN